MPIDLAALLDPAHTAIITSEVQNGVVGEPSALPALAEEARIEMIPNLVRLLPAARAAGVQVVHCTAYRREDGKGANTNARLFMGVRRSPVPLLPATAAVQVLAELGPEPEDLVLTRTHGLNPMGGTDLDAVLRNLGIRTIVPTGVSVNIAVTNLVMDAVNAGYAVVLPRDAVAGIPRDYADAVIDNTLALLATVVTTDDLLSIWGRDVAGQQLETGVRGDLEWSSIPALARSAAERFGERDAVIDEDVRLSFTELAAAGTQAGRAFVAAGVEPGDRVAIWSPNIHEWIVALIGLQSVGGVLVPVNTRYKGAEAAYLLQASRARVLVAVNGFLGNDYLAMLDGHDLPHLQHRVVLRGDVPTGATGWADFLATGETVPVAEVDARVAMLGVDDVADIIFTSGTTGNPKGVVCTHGQTLRGFADWAAIVGLRAEDRYLVINPFFHSFGYKAGIVAALTVGATLVPQAVFDIPEAAANVARHAITALPGPPAIYQTFLNHPDLDRTQLATLRLAVTGAAPVPVELIRRMEEELGFETVVTAYGLTETCGIVSVCRPDDPAEVISASSGRAIPGVEVRVVDDEGVEVPRGQAGEIVVRGYNVMREYFEDAARTAETIDVDGWLHTGDIGTMDDAGYLAITDRKKDMFIVGGFNAYPAEIENLLLAHPDIAQVAVVGVPDERMGEVGVAFVVPTSGTRPVPDELVTWARATMANYKVPRQVFVVDALPVNVSNKVLKYQLREQAGL